MKEISITSDKIAIGISLLCLAHCLALPLLIILLPSIAQLSLEQETYHYAMVLIVVPISCYALILGYKKHNKISVLLIGVVGLIFLVLAVLLGEEKIGSLGEKTMTVIGSIIIAYSHYKNFNLSHNKAPCLYSCGAKK
ncbi:MerC domain-containing protein [Colwellia sp. D2M02]|uniref:MerC domain-containing protein n=1 Tax=Colwellia sp. D2M02 TaxID=2841562 RepID=UPI001C09C3F2|nr:MerC domain-containing protein [Colwellia sp. D2M02]MBU2893198.1 MerC domain-containing protein [Colwellia sp. D2M02]